MGNVTPFRPVSFERERTEHHDHEHHSHIGPNEQLVALINGVAADLQAYNQKVAKITHQEHLLNK